MDKWDRWDRGYSVWQKNRCGLQRAIEKSASLTRIFHPRRFNKGFLCQSKAGHLQIIVVSAGNIHSHWWSVSIFIILTPCLTSSSHYTQTNTHLHDWAWLQQLRVNCVGKKHLVGAARDGKTCFTNKYKKKKSMKGKSSNSKNLCAKILKILFLKCVCQWDVIF